MLIIPDLTKLEQYGFQRKFNNLYTINIKTLNGDLGKFNLIVNPCGVETSNDLPPNAVIVNYYIHERIDTINENQDSDYIEVDSGTTELDVLYDLIKDNVIIKVVENKNEDMFKG